MVDPAPHPGHHFHDGRSVSRTAPGAHTGCVAPRDRSNARIRPPMGPARDGSGWSGLNRTATPS